MKKILMPVLILILLVPSIFSQEEILSEEKEVCLVYFVSFNCGDECGLTDEFMNGLINEYYGRLTAIKYYIDASYENLKIFEAYQKNYNIPPQVPLVLFGKNYYLLGVDEIYNQTEKIIFNFLNENGTNCPLESGYIPPKEAKVKELPGSPEVLYLEKNETEIENYEQIDGYENTNETEEINFDEIIFEEETKETVFSLTVIILTLLLVLIAVFFVWRKS